MERAQKAAKKNKAFWYLLFDTGGITYTELSNMDMADYAECMEAKTMYVQELKKET